MISNIDKLENFRKNYSQEVLLQERYTPASLLNSFNSLINTVKGAIVEINQKVVGPMDKKPAYAAGFNSSILNNNEFKNIFENLAEKVASYNYTAYASLKKAKVPSGIEDKYINTLQSLETFTNQNSLYGQIEEYKELLSKLLSQDSSVMKSSIARYSMSINKSIEPQQRVLDLLKSKVVNADRDFVKVSVVVSNASDWEKVYSKCLDLNWALGADTYDISKINSELKIIATLIDAIIEELSTQQGMNGSSLILSEISESTLALAKAVTMRANGLSLCLDTLGCIHETMTAIVQDQSQ